MSQGPAGGMHSRWKSWTNGPVMCPLWGLGWWLSPVRQSKDELSVYSHPLNQWAQPVVKSSNTYEIQTHWKGNRSRGQVEGGKHVTTMSMYCCYCT